VRLSVDDRDLYGGLIRLHVLHHAHEEPLYGQWMIEELQRHGYRIGPGTMYPLLHGLERKGYLKGRNVLSGARYRRVYRLTSPGKKALRLAKKRVQELFGEMFEEENKPRKAKRIK
jgi:PadR family transcriptional regulator, regulatory protein PadR